MKFFLVASNCNFTNDALFWKLKLDKFYHQFILQHDIRIKLDKSPLKLFFIIQQYHSHVSLPKTIGYVVPHLQHHGYIQLLNREDKQDQLHYVYYVYIYRDRLKYFIYGALDYQIMGNADPSDIWESIRELDIMDNCKQLSKLTSNDCFLVACHAEYHNWWKWNISLRDFINLLPVKIEESITKL